MNKKLLSCEFFLIQKYTSIKTLIKTYSAKQTIKSNNKLNKIKQKN